MSVHFLSPYKFDICIEYEEIKPCIMVSFIVVKALWNNSTFLQVHQKQEMIRQQKKQQEEQTQQIQKRQSIKG